VARLGGWLQGFFVKLRVNLLYTLQYTVDYNIYCDFITFFKGGPAAVFSFLAKKCGRMNASWFISVGNHSHLLQRALFC
jgi:hypothetical protein